MVENKKAMTIKKAKKINASSIVTPYEYCFALLLLNRLKN